MIVVCVARELCFQLAYNVCEKGGKNVGLGAGILEGNSSEQNTLIAAVVSAVQTFVLIMQLS